MQAEHLRKKERRRSFELNWNPIYFGNNVKQPALRIYSTVQLGFIDATNFWKMELLTFACMHKFSSFDFFFAYKKYLEFWNFLSFSSMSSIFMKIIGNKLLHCGLMIKNTHSRLINFQSIKSSHNWRIQKEKFSSSRYDFPSFIQFSFFLCKAIYFFISSSISLCAYRFYLPMLFHGK